jgi:hypothetical protein
MSEFQFAAESQRERDNAPLSELRNTLCTLPKFAAMERFYSKKAIIQILDHVSQNISLPSSPEELQIRLSAALNQYMNDQDKLLRDADATLNGFEVSSEPLDLDDVQAWETTPSDPPDAVPESADRLQILIRELDAKHSTR